MVLRIRFHPGHEEHSLFGPFTELGKVVVPTIHGNDGTWFEIEHAQTFTVIHPSFCHADELRRQICIIQQDMELNAAFPCSVLSPGKGLKDKCDSRGVKGQQLVLKSERLPSPKLFLFSECCQGTVKQVLKQLSRSVGISIGQSGLGRGFFQSQMTELPNASCKAITDLPERVRSGQVTE